MRILITGSRSWDDHLTIMSAIFEAIDSKNLSNEEVVVVHGDCPKGADRLASLIAQRNGLPEEAHPADWDRYGKRAGFLRNTEMVDLGADLCLAFIKSGSSGSSMTAKIASNAGIPTIIYSE